jgi:hypothetical protein
MKRRATPLGVEETSMLDSRGDDTHAATNEVVGERASVVVSRGASNGRTAATSGGMALDRQDRVGTGEWVRGRSWMMRMRRCR